MKEHRTPKLGTDPPIDPWTSPWIGSTVDEVPRQRREKPETMDLDRRHCAFLARKASRIRLFYAG